MQKIKEMQNDRISKKQETQKFINANNAKM
jgi:hypothetical protein